MMSPESNQDPVVLEAIKWFVRLRDDEATDEDRRAFEKWLRESPAHAEAWARANKLWERFDVPGATAPERTRPGIGRRRLLGGLMILPLAGAAFWLTHPELGADFRTEPGERRSILLPDGTAVELGSFSALSVRFDGTTRRTRLIAGEAFFDVVSDAVRPFIVEAEAGAVQALGTRFNVKISADSVSVAVAEHAVLVRSGTSAPMRVEQGYEINYDAQHLGPVGKADLDAVEAWRRDVLIFKEMPLSMVLRELERYRRGRIILVDRDLSAIPVTGVFNTRQTDAALNTIAEALSIRLFHATDYVVFVLPK